MSFNAFYEETSTPRGSEVKESPKEKDEVLISALAKNEEGYLQTQHLGTPSPCHPSVNPDAMRAILGEDSIPFMTTFVKNLGMRHVIGVQPMAGPVSLVYSLQHVKDEEPESEDVEVEGEGKIEPIVPLNALEHVRKVLNDTKDEDKLVGPIEKGVKELERGNRIRLQVVSAAVEAGASRLSSRLTAEAIEDLNWHGLDLISELRQALAAEVAVEYNASIYRDLIRLSGHSTEFDVSEPDGPERYLNKARTVKLATKIGQKFTCTLNQHFSKVAASTRRGRGNWIIVSPTVLAWMDGVCEEYKSGANELQTFGDIQHVGKLNKTVDVYCYIHADEDLIVTGYKGQCETDVGYTLCPYVPVMSAGIVVDPATFSPLMQLMTRRSTFVHPKGEDYYTTIKLTNAPWMKEGNEATLPLNKPVEILETLSKSEQETRKEQFDKVTEALKSLGLLID